MSTADDFHELMLTFGGRFPREQAPEPVRIVYDEIGERADDLVNSARRVMPRLPKIYVDFIQNPEINAIATRKGKQYFIGITTGTLFMLRTVIGRMLSDSRVFTFVGDPQEETSLPPIVEYSINADDMLVNGMPLTPRNDIRRSYAESIQDQAIMFLVGHELTHITHGHVDYLLSAHEITFTNELEWYGSHLQKQAIERQALEQDADRRSIISRIDSLRVTAQSLNKGRAPWASGDDSPAYLIRDWSIALNILFRLFGDIRFTHVDISNSNHPPVPLRRSMCEVAAFWAVCNQWDPALKHAAKEALVSGREEAEQAFSIILGQKTSTDSLREAFGDEAREYAVRLEQYWNTELVEKLRPFSYEF
jgi:hypothetical protein